VALELIVNVLLLILSAFCFWQVGVTMPKSADNELGAEQWPQALFFLLIIAIGWNLVNYFRKRKKEEITHAFADFLPGIGAFVRSKLFFGMILLVAMAFLYEPLGFLVTCILFMGGYGVLLGERRPVRLLISSVLITMLLYIGFSVFLGILLPRGDFPFLRSAALALESLFQIFK
jgi:hypothetical protein